jgi:MOSC domain-containing protein YiiM
MSTRPAAAGRLVSVNLAEPREIPYRGRTVRTGIWKLPAAGRVHAGAEGLEGDAVVDRRYHGGIDKAVYAYSTEDYAWWSEQLGEQLEPGRFGENLTTEGIDLLDARVGDRWRVGDALLEVSEPRIPCFKLGVRMGNLGFVKRFAKGLRLGAYLRVLDPGELGTGDEIVPIGRPKHDVTVQLVGRARLEDRGLAEQVLTAPEISDEWRRWAERAAAKVP